MNLAQRLESNATPGRMLLSEEVYKASAVAFVAAERKELKVKGREKPVVAFDCLP